MGRRKKRTQGVLVSRGSGSGSGSGSDSDGSGIAYMKIRERAPSGSKRKRSVDMEIKDMRKLDSNDEAFHLEYIELGTIRNYIVDRETPTLETYKKWDEYKASFYLKMCTCYGVDPDNLEGVDENGKKIPVATIFTKNVLYVDKIVAVKSPKNIPWIDLPDDQSDSKIVAVKSPKNIPWIDLPDNQSVSEIVAVKSPENIPSIDLPDDQSDSKIVAEKYDPDLQRCINCGYETLSGPWEFGVYSSKGPDRIPYHLYLLLKEVVDMKNLDIVEKKIKFFCTYFHSHIPTGWEYKQCNANLDICNYDSNRHPRYNLTGYTPMREMERKHPDKDSYLYQTEMADLMSTIHSKKTPDFTEMGPQLLSFYCKLCSCFGLKYHDLETASDDDVCLMNMGRNDH